MKSESREGEAAMEIQCLRFILMHLKGFICWDLHDYRWALYMTFYRLGSDSSLDVWWPKSRWKDVALPGNMARESPCCSPERHPKASWQTRAQLGVYSLFFSCWASAGTGRTVISYNQLSATPSRNPPEILRFLPRDPKVPALPPSLF